jgi:hypothetical protein
MLPAGGTVGYNWVSSAGAGLFRRGYETADRDKDPFTPLFVLKRPVSRWKRLFRDEEAEQEEVLWEDVHPPWLPLDEDGEEDPFEDTVSKS